MARWVARQIVTAGIAAKVELQVAYAFGTAEPLSICANTFGTGDPTAAEEFAGRFDFRPAAITVRFALRRPIYRQTSVYGHFGRPELPWEQ
jgi:S-adenosylmethionine synthetase